MDKIDKKEQKKVKKLNSSSTKTFYISWKTLSESEEEAGGMEEQLEVGRVGKKRKKELETTQKKDKRFVIQIEREELHWQGGGQMNCCMQCRYKCWRVWEKMTVLEE